MKLHIIDIEPDIMKSKIYVNKIMDFCSLRCNKISFEIHLSNYNLSEEEYKKACNDFYEYYRTEDVKRRTEFEQNPQYKNSLLNTYYTKDEVFNYFDRLHEYDLVQYNEIINNLKQSMNSNSNKVKSPTYAQDKFMKEKKRLYLPEDAYLSSRYTFESHCTIGGLYKVYDFKLNISMISSLKETEDLFKYYSFHDSDMLEDPAFYMDNTLVLSICTHERTANLFLSDDQLNEFKKFEIPHSCC
jgi:hypothetical protein